MYVHQIVLVHQMLHILLSLHSGDAIIVEIKGNSQRTAWDNNTAAQEILKEPVCQEGLMGAWASVCVHVRASAPLPLGILFLQNFLCYCVFTLGRPLGIVMSIVAACVLLTWSKSPNWLLFLFVHTCAQCEHRWKLSPCTQRALWSWYPIYSYFALATYHIACPPYLTNKLYTDQPTG